MINRYKIRQTPSGCFCVTLGTKVLFFPTTWLDPDYEIGPLDVEVTEYETLEEAERSAISTLNMLHQEDKVVREGGL